MQMELCTAFHISREDTKDGAYEMGDISGRGEGIVGNVRFDVVTMSIKATRRWHAECKKRPLGNL